jgi:glyoxylase-like metal-dependent hydrolase (beta-lactamase superfamily II)
MKTLNRSARWPVRLAVTAAGAMFSSMLAAQAPAPISVPLVKDNSTVKVSEHVYVIPDKNSTPLVPNIGIIVGSKATLVVDTGLGQRNGETVLREVGKVSKNALLYVASTHFHPEHTTGGMAFPADTKFTYPQAQQKDIEEFGQEMLTLFRKRSPEIEELLKGATYRRADLLFEREETLDLGGVHVRLTWLGPTHTRGDTAIFVEEDKVLFSGDLAMKGAFPAFVSPYASGKTWLVSLDRLDALHPGMIVPSHGQLGDASMIGEWRNYFNALQARVRELKGQGKSVDEADKLVTAEFTAKYPNWAAPVRISGAVKAFYAEL